jgi:hypothetical protein
MEGHPLVMVLVVPFAGGSRVPSRDDPLEPHGPSVDEHIDALGGEPASGIGEEVAARGPGAWLDMTPRKVARRPQATDALNRGSSLSIRARCSR